MLRVVSKGATSLSDQTPFVLIDVTRMDRNILVMAEIAGRNLVSLRPHVKIHKIPAIARKQVEVGATGITVAKVSEAEIMADGGLDDIFIAYPVETEAKIRRAILLNEQVRLILGVDSLEGARMLSSVARGEGIAVEVRLEVDTGLKRTGVRPQEAVELAGEISKLGNLDLTGIYTHRGVVLENEVMTLDLEKAGYQEGELMVSLANQMRESGIKLDDVSLGSTPTAKYAAEVEGVTEIRPGTYVFYDRMQAKLGACSLEDCATRVLATVVSRPTSGLATIDGRSKTFATDVQPGKEPLGLEGFGRIIGHPRAVLERLTEEHGMLALDEADDLGVGDTVEIVPNHVCSTVNLHDDVYLHSADDSIQKVRVAARGRVW